MSTLRRGLIRLARTNPELRPIILPLLTEPTTKVAFWKLTTRDEKVALRWWERLPGEGDILFSDGEVLSGIWGDVSTPLFAWQGWGTFKTIPTMNPKRKLVQQAVRELMTITEGPLSETMKSASKKAALSNAAIETAILKLQKQTDRNDHIGSCHHCRRVFPVKQDSHGRGAGV